MLIDRRTALASSTALAGWMFSQPVWASVTNPATQGPLSPDMPIPLGRLPDYFPPDDPGLHRLDTGWRFHEGDIPVPEPRGNDETYGATKTGNARGGAAFDFDDSDWAEVSVPHDWAITHPISRDENSALGYRHMGTGWYRRTLMLPGEWQGLYLELQLGAIAGLATVWFNGVEIAHSHSGYVQLNLDITPYSRFEDEPNTIAIHVDANALEGWWYNGAGLYRDCWLAVRPSLHIATDGIYADPRHGIDAQWHIPVTATLENSGETVASGTLKALLRDPSGKVVCDEEQVAQVPALGRSEVVLNLPVAAPRLWSPEDPQLYVLETKLVGADGTVTDGRRTELGFRTIHFDAVTGFHLNDRPFKIKGVCIHQDHAGVGVAMPEALWEWKVRRLRQIGCNAIRSTHHAPSKALLDACDRQGMLVMGENRHFNPSPDYMAHLQWMVRRDRNRPSVIMWSVLNEEPMQGTRQGYEMVRRLAAEVKALDDARPVTAAMNDGMFTEINGADAVDVVGFNYKAQWYDRYHAAYPRRTLISTEDTSAVMTRGEWSTDPSRNVLSSYDIEAPEWGLTHHESWKRIGSRPFIAGTFVWTGFDYHGEPTPLPWPAASSSFGILDLCGFGKMAYHLRRAQWIESEPVLALAPHWNWPGREGQPIRVMALTNVEEVALVLNGVPMGRQSIAPFQTPEWQIPYAPGKLEAIGFRDGREVARAAIETVGRAVRLRLSPDRPMMLGSGRDVQPVSVDLLDEVGRHLPIAADRITFSIEGGTIAGVGNGNPNDHDPEQGVSRRLFAGLAQVLVRADRLSTTRKSHVTLIAQAEGLAPARIDLPVIAAPDDLQIAAPLPVQTLSEWRRTPFTAQAPDARTIYTAAELKALIYVRPGRLEDVQPAHGFTLLQSHYTPRRPVAANGGELIFTGITGRASLWIDGIRVARKDKAAAGELRVTMPPGGQTRVLTLVLETDAGEAVGLSRTVVVRART